LQNNIIYDKPFKTFDEQIAIMQSRGIKISNIEKAKKILEYTSYYSIINGYKNTFLQSPNADIFIPGTTFEEIYLLYLLDSDISNIILKYILFIERSFKTKLSYRIAEGNKVHHSRFLDVKLYKNKKTKKDYEFLKYIKNKCEKPYENTTSHYYHTTKNHVPPWIVINDISFNKAIYWYSLLKSKDKDYIVDRFFYPYNFTIDLNLKKEFLNKSLNLLLEYRNSIAHGNKIFASKIKNVLPKNALLKIINNIDTTILSEKEYIKGLGQKDLYAVVLAIAILLDNSIHINSFRFELTVSFQKYNNILVKNKPLVYILELPINFSDRLNTLVEYKINNLL